MTILTFTYVEKELSLLHVITYLIRAVLFPCDSIFFINVTFWQVFCWFFDFLSQTWGQQLHERFIGLSCLGYSTSQNNLAPDWSRDAENQQKEVKNCKENVEPDKVVP